MWDIIGYDDHEISLHLRNKKSEARFGYPWRSPTLLKGQSVDNEARAQAINIAPEQLFDELCVRVRYAAWVHCARLARSSLNGKPAADLTTMHTEALKFSLKRLERKMISAEDFVGMVRCCAIIQTIPESFWGRIRWGLDDARIEKLQQAMTALEVFHPRAWTPALTQLHQYMARTVWFSNDFDSIRIAALQFSLCFPDFEGADGFKALVDSAGKLLKHQEIEQEQATKKPWQRGAPSRSRSVRAGPTGNRTKKTAEQEQKDED